jgi:hypothetical protein
MSRKYSRDSTVTPHALGVEDILQLLLLLLLLPPLLVVCDCCTPQTSVTEA